MNYALIENGIVANIIYLHPMNADEFPQAVEICDLPVEIGDSYIDGKFYRNGKEVGTAEESSNDYGISDDVYNQIIDDYTMTLIDGGVL